MYFKNIADITSTAATAFSFGLQSCNMNEDELEEIAVELTKSNTQNGFDSLYFAFQSTGHLSVGNRWQEPDDYDTRNHPWYKKAAQSDSKLMFSEPYIDAQSGELTITAAKAIHNEKGNLLGVTAGYVFISKLNEIVQILKYLEKMWVFYLKKME